MRICSFVELKLQKPGTIFSHWMNNRASMNLYSFQRSVNSRTTNYVGIWIKPMCFEYDDHFKHPIFLGDVSVFWSEPSGNDKYRGEYLIWELEELQELRSAVMRAINGELKCLQVT